MKLEEDQNENPHKTYYNVKNYYFCSGVCKELFDLDPERYIKQIATTLTPSASPKAQPAAPAPPLHHPAPPELSKPQPAPVSPVPDPNNSDKEKADAPRNPVCRVCNMTLRQDPKNPLKYTTTYQGKTYYFCSQGHKGEFAKNPKGYTTPGEASPLPEKQVKPPSPKGERVPKPRALKSPPAALPAAGGAGE
jgi:YHS domain-containing protein